VRYLILIILLASCTPQPQQVIVHKQAVFSWPSAGTISSPFGKRFGRMHSGIDIVGNTGLGVMAAGDGIVIVAGFIRGFGLAVMVEHDGGLVTLYGHNSRLYVKRGNRVLRGAVISRMGSTGRSTGIHLHFEVRRWGVSVDPMLYLIER